jgi:predicted methyltransferase
LAVSSFLFLGETMLANTRDPRTIPVWCLPSSLAQGQKDREKYEAIGEADNMTLKLGKPTR